MANVLKQKKMFLSLIGAAILAGTIALVQFAFTPHAQAASSSSSGKPSSGRQGQCFLATLNGMYAASQSGFQVAGSSKGPFATAATYVFNGRGNVHGFTTRSVNGSISENLSFSGTYTLNKNCTGTETVSDSTGAVRHYNLATVPSGSRFTFIRTDAGIVGVGSGERG